MQVHTLEPIPGAAVLGSKDGEQGRPILAPVEVEPLHTEGFRNTQAVEECDDGNAGEDLVTQVGGGEGGKAAEGRRM